MYDKEILITNQIKVELKRFFTDLSLVLVRKNPRVYDLLTEPDWNIVNDWANKYSDIIYKEIFDVSDEPENNSNKGMSEGKRKLIIS